jgi:hypothetical protein
MNSGTKILEELKTLSGVTTYDLLVLTTISLFCCLLFLCYVRVKKISTKNDHEILHARALFVPLPRQRRRLA